MSDSDPFLTVQSEVKTTLTTTRHLFSSYLRIRTLNPNTNPTTNPGPELQQSHSELLSNLSLLDTDLADLHETITAVESDPYRFGLDVTEVQRRRAFVQDVAREVRGMRDEISPGSNPHNTSSSAGRSSSPHDHNYNEDPTGDTYTEFEQQTQAQMFRDQDDQLDDVFHTVGVLRGQAQDMGRELEEQAGMLDEVDKLADRVQGKLNTGVKKIGEVIRRNEDTYSSCCIGVLVVVLIFLLVLVIAI